MKVCIDIQAAIGQHAGIGRYTRTLLQHLATMATGNEIRAFYFNFLNRADLPKIPENIQKRQGWCPGRLIQAGWKYFDLPPFNWLAGKADLYHFPNFTIPPLSSGKAIVTIHDASFLKYPEFTEPRNLAFLSKALPKTLRRADAFITISKFSAGEMAEHLKIDPAHITTTYLGVADHFQPQAKDAVAAWRQRQGLKKPYLLSVGTLEPRKNHSLLIRIFEELPQFDGQLVIAGQRGWKYEPIIKQMRESKRARDIIYLEHVSDTDLPCLYAGCELFIFPSYYEGFGLPPVEAMACGAPVIASAGGSLAEILGTGAWLLHDFNLDAWLNATQTILTDSGQRNDLIKLGIQQAARYTWQQTARQTWALYQKMAK